MFTFAQYVLGIGKSIDERPIENNTNTITNANSAANSNSKDCSLTNIENDWILINNVDENEQSDPIKVDKIVQKQSNHASNKKAIKNSGQESSSPSVQRSSLSKNENQLTANVNSKKCQQNNQQEQTNSSLQTEKLDNEQLIEERIFDNLFVKKPPFTVPLFPVKSEQAKKLIFLKIKNSANNKNFGNKENLPLNRSKRNNKNNNKNGTENLVNTGRSSASLTLNTSSKNVSLAIEQEKAKCRKEKKNINKKKHQRQNKVAVQRNGPIIRKKKMFTHINGIYHNRNNC